MQFRVIVDFHEINMIEVNVDNPESAANAVLKLYKEGRLKPDINEIVVFNIEDELGFEPPVHVLTP